MIYTWKCMKCAHITEVERKVIDYLVGPKECKECKGKDLKLVILKAPTVPFQHLRESGVLADADGTFAPKDVKV